MERTIQSGGEGAPGGPALVVALALVAFSIFFYISAWTCDDAFLAFRVVDNFVHGHGLRWNVIERVQVFTSPLFTLLMGAGWWVVHDHASHPDATGMYLLAIGVGYLLSAATVAGLALWIRRWDLVLVVMALLLSSQTFVLFSSSGLETSLLNLLTVGFAIASCRA